VNLTLLNPHDGRKPTKSFTTKDGELVAIPYPSITFWKHGQVKLDTILDYHNTLPKIQGCVLIRGTPDPSKIGPAKITKRNGENFPDRGCNWLMIDIDKYPATCDEDGTKEFITKELPAEFQDAACSVQFSASAGIYWQDKPIKPGLSCHLMFALDHPLFNREVKRWLAGRPLDCALYSSVQPHYITDPIVEEGIEIRLKERHVFFDGAPTVVVPEIKIPEKPKQQRRSYRNNSRTLRELMDCDFIRYVLSEGLDDGDGRYEGMRAFCHNVALVQRGDEIIDRILNEYENEDAIRRSLEGFDGPIRCETFLPTLRNWTCPKWNGERCSTGATAPIAIRGGHHG